MEGEQADKIIYIAILQGGEFLWKDCPTFSANPLAWTPSVYQWISEQGLVYSFVDCLHPMVYGVTPINEDGIRMLVFANISSSPFKKAIALATAIEAQSQQ